MENDQLNYQIQAETIAEQLLVNRHGIKKHLNYLEQLAVSLTCQILIEAYRPDPIACVTKGFQKRGIDYIDLKNKGAYISGGFLSQCVYGLHWPESDIDIYSDFNSVIHEPINKPIDYPNDKGIHILTHQATSLFKKSRRSFVPNDIFWKKFDELFCERGIIGDMKHQKKEKDFYSFRYCTEHLRYSKDPLYTLISQDLWQHPQISYIRTLREDDKKIIRFKNIRSATEECHDDHDEYYDELGYISEKASLLFIKQIKNWYIGSGLTSYNTFPYNCDLNKLLKIQNILLNPEYSIQQVVGQFDINLCRVYFDGNKIMFHNLDDFFKGRLNYQLIETDMCAGQIGLFHEKTFRRLEKYYQRFQFHYPQVPIEQLRPTNALQIITQLFDVSKDILSKSDSDNYPSYLLRNNGLPIGSLLIDDVDTDYEELPSDQSNDGSESSEKLPTGQLLIVDEHDTDTEPDLEEENRIQLLVNDLEEQLAKYPDPSKEFLKRVNSGNLFHSDNRLDDSEDINRNIYRLYYDQHRQELDQKRLDFYMRRYLQFNQKKRKKHLAYLSDEEDDSNEEI